MKKLIFNQWVIGSNPVGLTIYIKSPAQKAGPFDF